MKHAWLIAAACSSRDPASPSSAPPPPAAAPRPVVAAPADATTPDAYAGTLLHATALVGPAPGLIAACETAAPCGALEEDARGSATKRPTKPDCSLVGDPNIDENGADRDNHRAQLAFKRGNEEIRIGGVLCASPPGMRGIGEEYYVFVKRADGWWRSPRALWTHGYNEKYCAGMMVTRWNDRGTRTFLGIAATTTCLACNKQGDEDETLELMLRFELAGPAPIVFGPLVVGEHRKQQRRSDGDPGSECEHVDEHLSMDEHWSSDDELVLTGPARWYEPVHDPAGLLEIWIGQPGAPSTAGTYRFVR